LPRSHQHPNFSREQFENCLERVAEGIEDQADLDHALKCVHPDSRAVVRERMKPFLKFTPEGA
jgi:hypothetical protein